MKKMVLSVLAVLLISMLAACSETNDTDKNDEEDQVTSVETTEIEKGDLQTSKSFYGRTEPNKTSPVMLPSSGEIESLEVSEGDKVKEDDLIAKVKTQAGTTDIKAPKDGTIVNLEAKEEDMVSGEDPLAIVAELDSLQATFEITSTNHSLFKKDDERKVAYEGETFDAKVTKVSSMPGETGLFSVETKIENKDDAILPGSVVKLDVPMKQAKDSLLVPTEAIVEEEDDSFIFQVNNDKVKKIKVEVNESQSDKTAITSDDLKEGDEIVLKGQLTLSDGDEVNVVEAGE